MGCTSQPWLHVHTNQMPFCNVMSHCNDSYCGTEQLRISEDVNYDAHIRAKYDSCMKSQHVSGHVEVM